MERVEYTLGYIVFTVCVLFTPNEFRSAGLTVQNLFSSWIGSEDIGFIQFHLRRTALTLLIHCALPLGYYVGMCLAAPEENLFSIHSASSGWQLYFGLSATLQLFSVALVFYWSRNGWSNHPISHTLSKFALPQSSWRSVASSINTEFRRIEKFATGPPDARVIVTDTWVMKVTVYRLHVTLQQDAHLTVIDSKQHDMSPDSGTPVQILTLRVASINPNIKSFDIRRASEYIYTDGRGVLEMRCVQVHFWSFILFILVTENTGAPLTEYNLDRRQQSDVHRYLGNTGAVPSQAYTPTYYTHMNTQQHKPNFYINNKQNSK
ncbi:E3 ubiquitin-protein ligase TM129 isoform X5 [Astyanax mexicanus]|uniref:E3 ubiquitin-protein ligase TM129 isoform X5 n=1 Tax=Astyanax mexicanus TaxID=7994 RepID=UPI0020CB26FA|nr:E3 ubiquitin-protein ligase TM129 isoform X5 [Astyanax mexicanus]